TASVGENIVVRMGETTTTALTPELRLYSPNGILLSSSSGQAATEVTAQATNNGTFLVVASDLSSGFSGTGNYRLSLAKTGSGLTISSNDEGGALTNGVTYLATIDTGDIDAWTFTANAGENIVVRMGELTASLTPHLRLYGPSGALLDSGTGQAATEVTARATNSGTFLVIAGDFSAGYSGTGNYRLTLAKTGSAVGVSPGDEGGSLNGTATYDGTVDVGDLDVWRFTACANDNLVLRMDELIAGSSLTPQLRLYGRDGTLLNTISGASTAEISLRAPLSGNYTVVAGDFSSGYAGSGTYRLTVNGLSDALRLCIPTVSGTNANLTGIGGLPGASFVLLTTTNVTTAVGQWSPILTNQFDQFGVFTYTNSFSPGERQRYFLLRLQ
ncbi:MAG: hypothetical protein DME26_07655, partial [Verrucomicrobia bacterium]